MTTLQATPRSVHGGVYGSHHHHHAPQQPPIPPLGGPPSDKHYGFPIESNEVLLSTLAKIGITDVKEHDIVKPTQQVVLTCFSAFLELLSYVNDEVVDTLKNDCLDRLEHRVRGGAGCGGGDGEMAKVAPTSVR